MENTKIEWAHHTWNPWVGCTRISPACDYCYAADWAKRTGQPHLWDGERRRTSASNWHLPLKWDQAAAAAGRRDRVFCGSLMDFADNQVPARWRDDAWHRIDQTRNLDWMLLSKRPQNYAKMLPGPSIGAPDWDDGWPNVWFGTTVEDRKRKVNIDHLRVVPARIRFLSIEPLLEDIGELDLTGIHLVICGGESGPHARPMDPEWPRSVRDQCAAAGVAYFHKQNGEFLGADQLRYIGVTGPGFGPFDHCKFDLRTQTLRVGKARAGRLLDGVEHNGMPEVRT
jgi:protein gp37